MKKFLLIIGLLWLALTSSATEERPASMIAKELIFPVSGKSNIGSYWGDARDAGGRRHEGIDVFASKGTPVVAVTDGYVLEVTEDGIGGKSVTIQSDDYTWRSYYAHLDAQKVSKGQLVKKGQLIGTVGNTGNAKTTPPHLHFGMYEYRGAIDPLPYVKTSPRIAAPVNAGTVVYKNNGPAKQETAKNTPRKKKTISPEIKSVMINVLSGIFSRKIRKL